ncbi:MAG: hypothetical protein QGH94_05440 [Phycisphaerae bacterium]|jgi:hypothetical protein|nr:hypothetical protein [Phycisphaerae bacterium]
MIKRKLMKPGRVFLASIVAVLATIGIRQTHSRIAMRTPYMAPTAGAATAARGLPAGNPSDVHVKNHGSVSFRSGYHVMNDGGGNRWDLQYYGCVYRGTRYAYSGGMYCHINGSNVQANNSAGWRNKSGDEIEIGPCNRSGLKVYRRIRVYKDRPLARWLEIFENSGKTNVTVNVQFYTRTHYSIKKTLTSSGKSAFGAADWAFRTTTSSSNGVPLLHVVTSKGAKLRPSVQIQGSTIYVRYNGLVVPAGKTVILCHFESQSRSADVHSKMMAKFPMHSVMNDLPISVRSRILNMKVGSSFGGVELERLENADNVLLKNDDPIVGEIRNESFKLLTIAGPMELKPANVIGMASGPTGVLRFAMSDGQVISGTSPGTKLDVALDASGLLHIPLEKIAQWSYRISPQRPDESVRLGPSIVLTTGDHLALDNLDRLPRLAFQWACGRIDLDAEALQEISVTSPGSGKFNATFRNGTHISGKLISSDPAPDAEGLVFNVKTGGEIRIKPEQVAAVRLTDKTADDGTLTRVALSGGDKLFGELTDETFVMATSREKTRINVSQIKSIQFKSGSADQTTVKKWDGKVIKGKLNVDEIGFAVSQGDRWSLPIGKITSITCPQAIPPKAMRIKIKKLIAQLGAEDYKDRQAASKALVGMGKGIISLIKPHLTSDDPEIRQRIEDVLEQLGIKAPQAPVPAPTGINTIHLNGGQWQIEQGGQIIINGGGMLNINNAPQPVW